VVSRVLREDPQLRVRAATRERVLRWARELDYVPNQSARALRMASSGALGLILHDLTNPLYAGILKGAQEAADHAGYVVLLADADELARNQDAFRRLLRGQRIDGALFQAGGFAGDATVRSIAAARLPTVLINSDAAPATGSVVIDDVAAGRVAATHLLELGHRRVAFLGGRGGSEQGARRRRGVTTTLAGAGIALAPEWVLDAGWDEAGGREAMAALLARPERPTAVVVANVMAAIGALAGAREYGARVPGELSIVAIHDLRFAELTTPSLTAVELPLRAMASAGVELLLRLIQGGEPEEIVVVDPPPRLIRRDSTAPP
jgi:DNA-binding LacI/PurR family transcriptional regulator